MSRTYSYWRATKYEIFHSIAIPTTMHVKTIGEQQISYRRFYFYFMVSDYRRYLYSAICSGYVISNIVMHAVLSNKISYKRCIK